MIKTTATKAVWQRTVTTSLDELKPTYGSGPVAGDISLALVTDTPMDDRTEKFLFWGLSTAEISTKRLWKTSRLSRSPHDTDHPNSVEGFEKEEPSFKDEIRYLVTRGLRVLIVSGYQTMKTFNLTTPISKLRGSVYVWNTRSWEEAKHQTDNTILLVVTYDPAYLVRNRWVKSGKGRADFAVVWLDDLAKAKRIAKDGWTPPKENFNIRPTLADIIAFADEHTKKQSLIAVDIETTGLTPTTGKVVCIGFAPDGENALVVPFGGGYWPTDIENQIRNIVSNLLSSNSLMFQNALFDVPFLQGRGFTCPMENVKHDTLLLHHAVSPELPHNLGFIVSQYGATPYWKEEFQNRDVSITRMDEDTLHTYNARDCVVLHQVLPELLKDLDELQTRDVYENESIVLLPAIHEMMSTGVLFDEKQQKLLKKRLQTEAIELELGLRTTGKLPEAFNIASDDDLRLLLFGTVSTKYAKGEGWEKKKPGTKVRQQLEDLYKVRHETIPLCDVVGYKGRRTANGAITVNKQGRLSYQRHLQNRLRDISKLKKPTPKHREEVQKIENALTWLKDFQDYTELKKILSTYLDYPVGDENRVHTKFIIHGTATGRLASREPNLQNLPKRRSKDIRRMFIAPPGHTIVAADYSNLEVKVMAYETGDPVLIDIVDNGKNMHDLNTQILFNLTPDDALWEAGRRAAKIFMFGSLAYGGGDGEIYEKVILDVPELRLTFHDFVAAKKRYMESHPVYTKWREDITEKVRQTRRITNAFGRVRTFYGNDRDIIKEALNFPIQSAAASIINRATVRIYKRLHVEKLQTRLQAQIHDELRFETPINELPYIIKLVEEEMSRPVAFRGTSRMFGVDVVSGDNWADLNSKGTT